MPRELGELQGRHAAFEAEPGERGAGTDLGSGILALACAFEDGLEQRLRFGLAFSGAVETCQPILDPHAIELDIGGLGSDSEEILRLIDCVEALSELGGLERPLVKPRPLICSHIQGSDLVGDLQRSFAGKLLQRLGSACQQVLASLPGHPFLHQLADE
ncbi:MAG: hypothetical protein AMS25_17570, partial [Gemmatimonas sp. SM23_52]